MQSFAAGEVTPELAHQIAKELADRVLGGRYEYVIGTHLNTGHIHSHIVWNSVSCVDGKKYRSNYKSYVTEIRAVSDELCRKYKLSVIDTENSNHVAKPYAEWRAEKSGQSTWRTAIRQDVDDAIQQSLTWRQFLTVLERKGYLEPSSFDQSFIPHNAGEEILNPVSSNTSRITASVKDSPFST